MNINDYISSGILEDYVLQRVSEQERREVECMSKIYPEIKNALETLQFTMVDFLEHEKQTPPAHIKSRLLQSIQGSQEVENNNNTNELNKTSEYKSPEKTKIIKRNFKTQWAVAASLSLFAVSSYLYYKSNQLNNVLMADLDANKLIKNQLEEKNNKMAEHLDILSAIGNNFVKLKYIPGKDSSMNMMIVWNKHSQKVYIDQINLPATTPDKQYQLWAIKDGKPVDLGVFNMDISIQQAKSIDNAQAFAVTLERKGGSENPTMDQMMVMGTVSE